MKVIHIIPHCRDWAENKALCSRANCNLSAHRVPTRRGFTFLRLTKEEAVKYRWCKRCLHEATKSKWRQRQEPIQENFDGSPCGGDGGFDPYDR